MARSNPVAFSPAPVTLLASAVYLALLVPLLIIHFSVPSAPTKDPEGLDIHEAWRDLLHLTDGYHPFNSHRNDEVHDWILDRINSTLRSVANSVRAQDYTGERGTPEVYVFDDKVSNLSYAGKGIGGRNPVNGVYFEGTNIIVYIRGTEDDRTNWWEEPGKPPAGKGGVLVNAHYDSVSTGFGATDDGVGVVTLLQLLKYFTTPGHHPRKGLVLLFNNGEEDFLNGANVFTQHPLSNFSHSFVNLEGAGAGGRAVLFRSTDAEVARFYKNAKHPFGSVLGNDGFKQGLIRSETDYAVFAPVLGMRGLDVSFFEPRSRYHTHQDDARHTSKNSLWHMLSSAVGTTEALASYDGDEFDKQAEEDCLTTSPGKGSTGVWFDLFGSHFTVFRLHTLFAVSVTLLICGPVALALTSIFLSKSDRMYLFSNTKMVGPTGDRVKIKGFRGLFRTPIILVVAGAGPVGLAFLVEKVNPYIVHSQPYMVWTMMASLWLFLAWFFSRIGDFARPSALHRAYGFTWLTVFSWILLVINTVEANQHNIASGYFVVFYFLGAFLATWISYLEFFSLPRKLEYAAFELSQGNHSVLRPRSASTQLLMPSPDELQTDRAHDEANESDEDNEEGDADESTSLLRPGRLGSRPTFANYTRASIERVPQVQDHRETAKDRGEQGHYGDEQPWSSKLPRWTWFLQLLCFAPIVIILVGQIGLLVTSAISQIGQDGAPTFPLYLCMALCITFIFSPILPFMHRFTYHIPLFMFVLFVVTLIANLLRFPFNDGGRLKLFFSQDVDLDNNEGYNKVALTGIQPFVSDAISQLPSAMDKEVKCEEGFNGREQCTWEGIMPDVLRTGGNVSDWLSYNISRPAWNEARFEIAGRNTRACKLVFNTPVRDWRVAGSAYDQRLPHTATGGVQEIRLWSRTWDKTWEVDVKWDPKKLSSWKQHNQNATHPEDDASVGGKVICEWADLNQAGTIPAFQEIQRYLPTWSIPTKFRDGLVEGYKRF